MPNIITVNPKNQGERLDKFLTTALKISRSQIKKMIEQGLVLINSRITTVHHFLKKGEKIEIIKPITPPSPRRSRAAGFGGQVRNKLSNKSLSLTDNRLFKKIKVVADEKNFLIIEKPAGLLVHPTEKNETNTLADWLIAQYPKLKKIGEDPGRPAIVHRLDKDVSGLMLIPKNQDAFDYFKKMFKERRLTKKYLALVSGRIEKPEDKIDFPIGRSQTKTGLFAAHPRQGKDDFDPKDKKALTIFTVKERFINYTFLEIEILTGRTHQIRVHLLAYGHPVVGDRLYAPKQKIELDRLFLHAAFLSFADQDGRRFEFISPLPKKLKDFLKGIK